MCASMSTRNGQVTSHVTVDRPETLTLLQSQQPQLERALEQAGLKTADNGLQFSLRDQSFAGQNNGGGAQPNPAQQLVIPDPDLPPVRRRKFTPASISAAAASTFACNRQLALRTDHDDAARQFPRRRTSGSTTNSSANTGNTGLAQLADNFNSFLTLADYAVAEPGPA